MTLYRNAAMQCTNYTILYAANLGDASSTGEYGWHFERLFGGKATAFTGRRFSGFSVTIIYLTH